MNTCAETQFDIPVRGESAAVTIDTIRNYLLEKKYLISSNPPAEGRMPRIEVDSAVIYRRLCELLGEDEKPFEVFAAREMKVASLTNAILGGVEALTAEAGDDGEVDVSSQIKDLLAGTRGAEKKFLVDIAKRYSEGNLSRDEVGLAVREWYSRPEVSQFPYLSIAMAARVLPTNSYKQLHTAVRAHPARFSSQRIRERGPFRINALALLAYMISGKINATLEAIVSQAMNGKILPSRAYSDIRVEVAKYLNASELFIDDGSLYQQLLLLYGRHTKK
ncbi:hypothetical protein KA012_04285 [Candidatus Woesebacteria bacterium]|nr:hypothetical protein [Candidatus Woesebacteria bacterium]